MKISIGYRKNWNIKILKGYTYFSKLKIPNDYTILPKTKNSILIKAWRKAI